MPLRLDHGQTYTIIFSSRAVSFIVWVETCWCLSQFPVCFCLFWRTTTPALTRRFCFHTSRWSWRWLTTFPQAIWAGSRLIIFSCWGCLSCSFPPTINSITILCGSSQPLTFWSLQDFFRTVFDELDAATRPCYWWGPTSPSLSSQKAL